MCFWASKTSAQTLNRLRPRGYRGIKGDLRDMYLRSFSFQAKQNYHSLPFFIFLSDSFLPLIHSRRRPWTTRIASGPILTAASCIAKKRLERSFWLCVVHGGINKIREPWIRPGVSIRLLRVHQRIL